MMYKMNDSLTEFDAIFIVDECANFFQQHQPEFELQ